MQTFGMVYGMLKNSKFPYTLFLDIGWKDNYHKQDNLMSRTTMSYCKHVKLYSK